MSTPSTSYDRGSRGHRGNGGRDRNGRDDRDRKRERDNGNDRPPRGKFQKRGSRGRGRGRGGARKTREEFSNVLTTRPIGVSKTASLTDTGAENDQHIMLTTNYYKVEQRNRVSMIMYRVDFNPPTDMRKVRWALMNNINIDLGLNVYDGANSVYLMNKLPQRVNQFDTQLRNGTPFTVTLRESREIHYTDGMFFTILNLILRRCFEKLDLVLVGRNFFDAIAAIDVPSLKLQIWPGFITSIRQHEDDILVCVDLAHKIMRQETVWDIIKECVREAPGGDFKTIAAGKLLGTTVLTTYNNKTYRVDDIDWVKVGSASFPTPTGVTKTYNEYYLERYQIDNLDPEQPLILSKAKAKNIRAGSNELVSLIPQLCIVTGMNDSMRTNFQMMRELSQHTRLTPKDRINRLQTLNGRLQRSEPRKIFNENRVELGRELVRVQGRRIVQETIEFGNAKVVNLQMEAESGEAADWTKNCRSNVLFMPKNLSKWVFICPNSCRDDGEIFLKMLTDVATRMGMEVSQNFKREYLADDRIKAYLNVIDEYLTKDPLFFVIIVENMRADRYAEIKKRCCCTNSPVPSQIIVKRTISSNRQNLISVVTKVAIQINCKLGGIPWQIKIPINDLLLIGYDVTHDTRNKRNSYGAMVANLNPKRNGGSFYSRVNSHNHGDLLSNNFGVNVVHAVDKYKELNNCLPAKIIIYRDGVGDGQIEYVNNCEVSDVKAKLDKIYGSDPEGDSYKLMFVIINKRINTRFFRESRNRAENPLPGTVVDSVITLPERHDFYMVSQNVNQGTVSPTSYNIISNNVGLNSAQIQKLTFKFCHTYYNWSGTTRVPSVVQYAKKLALLVGQHLHAEPTKFKDDCMLYFL